jgi:hypothetical protein
MFIYNICYLIWIVFIQVCLAQKAANNNNNKPGNNNKEQPKQANRVQDANSRGNDHLFGAKDPHTPPEIDYLDILSIDRVDQFETFKMTYPAYKHWPKLEFRQKLAFIVDRAYLVNIKRDFLYLSDIKASDRVLKDNKDLVHYDQHQLEEHLREYQDQEIINTFFRGCDEDRNRIVDWYEYIVCRGYYDQLGNPFSMSEFDTLENIALLDFKNRLYNPHDPMTLELLDRDEL